MSTKDDDLILVINIVKVLIEGRWYTLEIAVLPSGVVHSIIQIGRGEEEAWRNR
jgi:hypothetical protein